MQSHDFLDKPGETLYENGLAFKDLGNGCAILDHQFFQISSCFFLRSFMIVFAPDKTGNLTKSHEKKIEFASWPPRRSWHHGHDRLGLIVL
jgi:hypothetical protein